MYSIESHSNGFVRLVELTIHNTNLISPNISNAFFHEYAAWLSMLNHVYVVPVNYSCLGYRSGSIFRHQWLYDARISLNYVWQAAFHMCKIDKQRVSASVHMKSNVLAINLSPILRLFRQACTFSVFCYVLCLQHQVHLCSAHEISHDDFPYLKPPHHKFLQAIFVQIKEINQNFPQITNSV